MLVCYVSPETGDSADGDRVRVIVWQTKLVRALEREKSRTAF